MAASFTIAARNNGFTEADVRAATLASVTAYREAMAEFAEMPHAGHLVRPPVRGGRCMRAIDERGPCSSRRQQEDRRRPPRRAPRRPPRRRTPATACRRCRSSPSWSTASTGSSASRRSSFPARELAERLGISRRRDRRTRSTNSSAPTGRRCRTTVATCSSASRSSTWPARSSASAASAPGRSSSCSRAATSRTRCSCRSRKRPARCWRITCPKSRYAQPGERVVQGQRMMQAASDIFLGLDQGRRGQTATSTGVNCAT